MGPFVPFISLALLASVALTTTLPECSSTSVTPCGCPAGTTYAQSVTFATIGAKATDIKALIGDFFQTAWTGAVPVSTQGRDNRAGALRTSQSAPGLTRTVTEELVRFNYDPSGSFYQKFQLHQTEPGPLQYNASSGLPVAGFWVTLQSSSIFQYETAIRWSVYACSNGHPLNYAVFHEGALANATQILQDQGKILGTNLKPISVQSF